MKKLFPLLLSIALVSCSFDYSEAEWEQQGEETPGLIIHNFRHTVVKNGKKAAEITAEKALDYRESNVIELYNVHFIEIDKDKSIIREATAEKGKFNRNTEDIDTSGQVKIIDFSQDFTLEGKDLKYFKNKHSIEAPQEAEVSIQKDQYSIRGTGFFADTRELNVKFSNNPEGYYEEN